MSRLVAAYERARLESRFTCPITGVELRLARPRYCDRRAAENSAHAAWGDRPIVTGIDVKERADLVRAHLIGECLFEQGEKEPVGAVVLELGEDALEDYDRRLSSLEAPPVEQWSAQDCEGLIGLLKKKDPEIGTLLRLSADDRLLGLLRYMADRLSTSTTSPLSSSGTSGP